MANTLAYYDTATVMAVKKARHNQRHPYQCCITKDAKEGKSSEVVKTYFLQKITTPRVMP